MLYAYDKKNECNLYLEVPVLQSRLTTEENQISMTMIASHHHKK